MKKDRKKIVFLFLGSYLLLTFVWFWLYETYLMPWGVIDNWLMENVANYTVAILDFLGYDALQVRVHNLANLVLIDGLHSSGVKVDTGCNGLDLLVLFALFIAVFPGKQLAKLWFLPFGMLAIHVVNILRITVLAIINKYYPSAMEFNHKYTFTILVYGFIFFLWYFWIKSYSGLKKQAASV